VICDDGKPRNAASSRIHGLIPAADLTPAAFREATRRSLRSYGEITCHAERVSRIEKQGSRFTYETHTGATGSARSVLLATGLVDTLPPLAGIEQFYGHTVHLCPYCDGYGYSDKHIVTYGKGEDGINLSLMLLLWSPHVTYCTDGEDLDATRRTHFESKGIRLEQRRITALTGNGRTLQAIALEGGAVLSCSALFFATSCRPASDLWQTLGCAADKRGSVACDPLTCETSVEGVYVAGDASRDVLQVASALGEGTRAAVAINKRLLRKDGLMP
jgi:thioredoxin reductase